MYQITSPMPTQGLGQSPDFITNNAVRTPQVQGSIANLRERVATLESIIENLQTRLQNVILNQPTTDSPNKDKVLQPVLCDIAANITEQAHRIGSCVESISYLLQKLEL